MIIYLFIINTLSIWGLRFLFERGELLGFIAEWFTDKLAGYPLLPIVKPLFYCAACMSSIWSIPFYVWGMVNYGFEWYYWPVYAISLCGFNVILLKTIKKE